MQGQTKSELFGTIFSIHHFSGVPITFEKFDDKLQNRVFFRKMRNSKNHTFTLKFDGSNSKEIELIGKSKKSLIYWAQILD